MFPQQQTTAKLGSGLVLTGVCSHVGVLVGALVVGPVAARVVTLVDGGALLGPRIGRPPGPHCSDSAADVEARRGARRGHEHHPLLRVILLELLRGLRVILLELLCVMLLVLLCVMLLELLCVMLLVLLRGLRVILLVLLSVVLRVLLRGLCVIILVLRCVILLVGRAGVRALHAGLLRVIRSHGAEGNQVVAGHCHWCGGQQRVCGEERLGGRI